MKYLKAKRILSVTMTLMLVFMMTQIPVAAAETRVYTDIEGHWAVGAIEKWSEKGVVKGYEDGTFKPDAPITGSELMESLDQLILGMKSSELADMPNAIVSAPAEPVSRQDAFILLYKAFGFKPMDTAWAPFSDLDGMSAIGLEAVTNMYEHYLLDGYADGTFRPSATLSRAALVKTIDKANLIGYVTDLNDGVDADGKITLLRETRLLGEVVYGIAIENATAIDGSALKTSDFSVDAIVGDVVGTRTVTKVYTNDLPKTAETSKEGKYIILELDTTTDMNSSTIYYDGGFGRNTPYHFNYYVSQSVDIAAADDTVIPAYEKHQSGNSMNEIIDQFDKLTYSSEAGGQIDYALFEPEIVAGEKYPLVIFLNGNGERGANGIAPLQANMGGVIWASEENQSKNPSFVLVPQNPLVMSGLWLEDGVYETTLALIKTIAENPLVDLDRIYITGVSMGGFGTWIFMQRNPELFAAAMPVCGGGDLALIDGIVDEPIWAFHGEDDPVVPVAGDIGLYMPEYMLKGTRIMVDALEEAGSTSIKYTIYEPGFLAPPYVPMAHFSWVPAYDTQEAIDWMFDQRNK